MKTEDWKGRCGCEVPGAPLGFGAYICFRPGCLLAIEATLRQYPDLKLVIKFGGPRQVVPAGNFLAISRAYADDPAQRCKAICASWSVNGADDYIREVFVMEGTGCPQEVNV